MLLEEWQWCKLELGMCHLVGNSVLRASGTKLVIRYWVRVKGFPIQLLISCCSIFFLKGVAAQQWIRY